MCTEVIGHCEISKSRLDFKMKLKSARIFYINNTFICNARLKFAKIKQILSNTLRLNFCYLKIIHILHPRYHPKLKGYTLKNKQKKSKCVCINEIMRIIVMKMKKRSHRYARARHRYDTGFDNCRTSRTYIRLLFLAITCIEMFGKMWLTMILKETKKQSFTLFSDSIFFEICS